MKHQLLKNILALVVFSLSLGVYAQGGKVKNAAKEFENFSFMDAREIYLRVADEDFQSPEVLKNLGDSYYLTAEYTEAAKWYGKLLATDSVASDVANAEYYFKYAQSLKSLQRYDLADEQMDKFQELSGNDSRAEMFSNERDYLKEIEAQSGRYSVEKVYFNSGLEDFGPSFYGDRVVFSSNRESSTGDFIHDWNDQPFLDLFIVENPSSETPTVTKLSDEMNTPYHESSSVFTKNGDVVYFTRNNYNKSDKLRKSEAGTTKLKLFRSYKSNSTNSWSTPEELPFNSDEFSTAHPALSADEGTLYFASDRPGTKGLSDLWKTAINVDGTFGDPINLGDQINTEGRETFPFITSDGRMFYATDGHVGLGGLDIFVTELAEDGIPADSYNVGKPVNSSADDFGLILDNDKGDGFFASNRATGIGNDDIYHFTREQELLTACAQNITGVTRDVKTDEILPLATVELRNIANEVVGTQTSDSAGRFSFPDVDCSSSYIVRASKKDYEPAEAVVNTGTEVGAVLNRDLYLKPPLKVELGDDLAKILNLNIIYFDYDKYDIRPDAAAELQKVIAVMREYPNLKIDVRSHTDSRAPDGYNMTLSQNRNLSTIRYIVNNGRISNARLTGRGYGETQLTNACGNGIECSEEEHQLNRRSEFIIVEK